MPGAEAWIFSSSIALRCTVANRKPEQQLHKSSHCGREKQ